jgi:hypothetical protein
MHNHYSNDFVRVELDETEIKDYLSKIVTGTETKVLVNLLLKYLEKLDDKKICACELLMEDLENFHEIKEACYCLAYRTKYITYQKIDKN